MSEENTVPKRRGRPPRLPRSSGIPGSDAAPAAEVYEPRRGRKPGKAKTAKSDHDVVDDSPITALANEAPEPRAPDPEPEPAPARRESNQPEAPAPEADPLVSPDERHQRVPLSPRGDRHPSDLIDLVDDYRHPAPAAGSPPGPSAAPPPQSDRPPPAPQAQGGQTPPPHRGHEPHRRQDPGPAPRQFGGRFPDRHSRHGRMQQQPLQPNHPYQQQAYEPIPQDRAGITLRLPEIQAHKQPDLVKGGGPRHRGCHRHAQGGPAV
jgi:hypothetical protein